jgi:putative addiction module component (TIGR02574 family)
MHRNARAVLNAALRLPEADRAEIAGALVASLEPAEDGCLEPGWRDEIAARVAKTNAGEVETIPWAEVRARLLARLSEHRAG